MNEDNFTISVANLEQNSGDEIKGENAAQENDKRISIHVHSIRKRLADPDGISAKAAIDGLVFAGILPDDSPKYVKEVSYSQEKGEPEETIITLDV